MNGTQYTHSNLVAGLSIRKDTKQLGCKILGTGRESVITCHIFCRKNSAVYQTFKLTMIRLTPVSDARYVFNYLSDNVSLRSLNSEDSMRR